MLLFEPLERYLSVARARVADSLILPRHRWGRILDLGCGDDMLFLKYVRFNYREKYGLDKHIKKIKDDRSSESVKRDQRRGIVHGWWAIHRKRQDIDENTKLPYPNNYFDTVTMLAVFEHLHNQVEVLKDVRRILKPYGRLILTVPSYRAEPIIKTLTFFGLLDKKLTEEHHKKEDQWGIRNSLFKAGFEPDLCGENGFFQCGLNMYVYVDKHVKGDFTDIMKE